MSPSGALPDPPPVQAGEPAAPRGRFGRRHWLVLASAIAIGVVAVGIYGGDPRLADTPARQG